MFISKRLEKIKAPWSLQSLGDALPLSETIATFQTWKQFWKESTQVVVNDASKNSRPSWTIVNLPVVHKIIPHGNAPLENLESETHWHWFRVCDVRVGCHTQHILNIIIGWPWLLIVQLICYLFPISATCTHLDVMEKTALPAEPLMLIPNNTRVKNKN